MLSLIFIGIICILAVVIAKQPDEFRITRTTTINAPVQTIFEQVNELQNWNAWSPWAKLDPDAKYSFEGPSAGTGAIMRWSGNSKVGIGSMMITESKPNDLIKFQLDFLKPFKATSDVEFKFKSEGNQTVVTWSMYGKDNFISKAMGLLMSKDKMVGGQFEQGLANLKSVVNG